MTEQELNTACEIVRDLANEYFGDWEQSCKFDDKFRKAMTDKTSPLFEQALSNVNPETRAEVRKNMDAVLTWHKASEELPKETCKVLTCEDNGRNEAIYLRVAMYIKEDNGEGHFIEYHYCDKIEPDYWMEIPELPKED